MPLGVSPRPRAVESAGRAVKNNLRPRVDKAFADVQRAWHHVNAYGQVFGRLASKIVPLLAGKHKPTYMPQQDMGDYVVVTNVAKIVVTGKKMQQKMYYRHSGYPGGLKKQSMETLMAKNPVEPFRRAIYGMLPKNRLRMQRMRRLRLFPGDEHSHEAQLVDDTGFDVSFNKQGTGFAPSRVEKYRKKDTSG